jgi:aminoglycoside/choline kinase family phosphotransferase
MENDSLDPRIARYLRRRSKDGLRTRSVTALAGDASTRSYYRVSVSARGEDGSLVLALMPDAFDPEREPFLNVARLFRKIPVRIPAIHDVSGPEGILLLEDCGDQLLQVLVERSDREARKSLYRQAIAILARIQHRGAELQSPSYLPYGLAFDEEKLSWELSYFRRHFLEGLRTASLAAAEAEALDEGFSRLARELAGLPRVLCHRDYHSRNLMVVEDELVVLDFQDARMGPVSYDLVSLLYDSYVELEVDLVEEMKEHFCRAVEPPSLPIFEAELALMGLQRNLKALGTFGYQITVRGKSFYQRYVPYTLELVRSNLARNPQWDGLRKALSVHLPELA